nr:hypothetical protein [Methanosarcina horonobensis]
MEEKYGVENVSRWRWDFEPGPPEGESLKAVYERTVPFFRKKVMPVLEDGKTCLSAPTRAV